MTKNNNDYLKFHRPDTFEQIRKSPEYQRLIVWLDEHGEAFKEAAGWSGPHDLMALTLMKLPCFIGDQLPMFKDNIDRAWDHTLTDFVRGKDVPLDDLRAAVALIMQQYNAACDRIHALRPRSPLPRPKHWPPPPRRMSPPKLGG